MPHVTCATSVHVSWLPEVGGMRCSRELDSELRPKTHLCTRFGMEPQSPHKETLAQKDAFWVS